MKSEDFDGRFHTYAIGIKLAMGPNLQVCNPIAKTAPNLHWIKPAKLATPVSRLVPGCRPRNQAFWGLRRLAGLVYMTHNRPSAPPSIDWSQNQQVSRCFSPPGPSRRTFRGSAQILKDKAVARGIARDRCTLPRAAGACARAPHAQGRAWLAPLPLRLSVSGCIRIRAPRYFFIFNLYP